MVRVRAERTDVCKLLGTWDCSVTFIKESSLCVGLQSQSFSLCAMLLNAQGCTCCHLYQWNRAFSAKTWALTVLVGLLPPLYFPDQACHTVRGRLCGLGGPEKTRSDDSGTWEEGWRRQHIFRLQQGQQDFSVRSQIVNILSLAAPHSFSAAYSLYVIYPFSDYRFWTHCMLWFATTGPEGRDRGPWVQSPCTMMGGGSTFWEPKTQQESWQGVSVLFPGMRSHPGNTIWKVKYCNFNGNPLQYSCLENPRDRWAWWAAVYGVAQSWIWLKRLSSSSMTLW